VALARCFLWLREAVLNSHTTRCNLRRKRRRRRRRKNGGREKDDDDDDDGDEISNVHIVVNGINNVVYLRV